MQRHRLTLKEIGFAYSAHRTADHVMATLNREQLLAIRDEEVLKDDRRLVDFKYFNVRPWIVENIKRALRLGLDESRGARLLDLGTGFGYFPYVCEFMEHEAEALDIPGHSLYDRIIDTLGIKRGQHRIMPFQPLPVPTRRYDYVTAYQVAFNRPDLHIAWGPEEWAFFINDVLDNQLTEGGRLHLELNWSFKIGDWYDPASRQLFDRYHAHRLGNEIDIYKTTPNL
ncbi:hypothetical protein [Salinisphaera sp. Q1T1-3]|uniref:hypothetical protein n=1 Tax=Salinisphaera sp. Q1T1-3 TaxID=2321229 RepID=UPI000E754F13|nr:hypothetical protein [Salinisphaera sp. Q1T1-3]RJS94733.1 hypothetical protein D3260_02860 [Salinisphaera sp. Q1T1-3]